MGPKLTRARPTRAAPPSIKTSLTLNVTSELDCSGDVSETPQLVTIQAKRSLCIYTTKGPIFAWPRRGPGDRSPDPFFPCVLYRTGRV